MVKPGQTTLTQIRQSAQARTDEENGPIPDDTWNEFIYQAMYELYGILIQSYGDNYKVKLPCFTFVTNGNDDYYPMPDDFLKSLIVEWQQVPNSSIASCTLTRTNYVEKNRVSSMCWVPGVNGWAPYYCDVNNELLLTPRASSGMTIGVWYIPRMTYPVDSGTVTLANIVAGNVLTINGVTFTAVVSGATGTQFNVGVSDTVTATNLKTVVNASTLAGLLLADSALNVVTLTFVNPLRVGTVTITAASATFAMDPDATWTNLWDGYNGWERYVIVDTSLQAMVRQGLLEEAAPYEREKAELRSRIESETKNRDAGAPMRVVDRRSRGGRGFGRGF